jgi:hypothetical protein
MRDDFCKVTKEVLAKRVSFKCSNPVCRKITVGPHSIDEKSVNLGVASHISAASKGGPRFNEEMQSQDRKSIKNGIWLCQNCAKLIDSDTIKYSINELVNWKSISEKESLSVISGTQTENQLTIIHNSRIKVYEKLFYEIKEVNSLLRELISVKGIPNKEKKEIAFYLGLQIAQFVEDNDFYIQDEIGLQCIGSFVSTGEIFTSNKIMHKEMLENYESNIRASIKLLKSVDSHGLIDTSQKTPLMLRYNELVAEAMKNDFIN